MNKNISPDATSKISLLVPFKCSPFSQKKFAGGLASAVYGRRAVLDAEHASPTQPLPAPAPALSNAPENGKPTAPLEKIDPPQGDVFGNFGNSSEGGALEAGASRLPGAATQPPIQSREGPRGGSKGAGRLTETGSVGPGGGGEDVSYFCHFLFVLLETFLALRVIV